MMISTCALCGGNRECRVREIGGLEYDICLECWRALAEKLEGKGRAPKRSLVVLPPPEEYRQETEEEPYPGLPPMIWFSGGVRSPKASG